MRVRHLWSGLTVACAAALIAVTGAPLFGQSAPRTPWGDPDLQGTYTNTYENGTPLERPDEFAGRTLDQVKGEELANIRRSIQKRTIGAFLGPELARRARAGRPTRTKIAVSTTAASRAGYRVR